MNKVYKQGEIEQKWYKSWEESGFFKPEVNPEGAPYCIILPPPNANAPLHFGHAMYVVEDILIRYHRMKGYSTLWLPGSDHAGFETQVVFERNLQKIGKSRFDFKREELYQMIWDYVQENKTKMENQLKRLGFSLDWSREKFTLDPDIIKTVYQTFKKMFDEGLIYRANKLVNYCTFHGTGFSDLEVTYKDKHDKLYFIKYPFADSAGYIIVATTRPETMFGDVAVVVNPKDSRYKTSVGKKVKLPLTNKEVPIIADELVDKDFGTGAVKTTPGHDPMDYEIGQKHNLEQISVINFDGTLVESTGKYAGSKVEEARKAVVEDLQALGLIEKIEDYNHRVGVCYKCDNPLQPLLMKQWFINIQDLKIQAVDVVKNGKIKIHPKDFETHYFQWLNNLRDWNISRQIVWGIRIPAWFCEKCDQWIVTEGDKPLECPNCGSINLEQDTDTFDTWFSSGQWPYATLQTTGVEGDFEKFYPTSVMETGYDILRAWVSRMVMLGLYSKGEVPFKDIVLHGLVLDPLGKKMSKSKGNVVSPMEVASQYGADAARMALVHGTAFGHDQSLSHPKLQAMRNFTNKLWNIGRFIIEFSPHKEDARGGKTGQDGAKISSRAAGRMIPHRMVRENDKAEHEDIKQPITSDDKEILEKLDQTVKKVTQSLDQYRFHDGAEALYDFIWHELADKYIEKSKDRRGQAQPVLEYVFRTSLEILHPFMPFITEELWQRLPHQGKSIMIAKWPEVK